MEEKLRKQSFLKGTEKHNMILCNWEGRNVGTVQLLSIHVKAVDF